MPLHIHVSPCPFLAFKRPKYKKGIVSFEVGSKNQNQAKEKK
jgi:hypothetical protein